MMLYSMMENRTFNDLGETEQHVFIRVVESSFFVHNRNHWEIWVRGELQDIMPHEVMVCWVRGVEQPLMHLGLVDASETFTREVERVFCHEDGVLPKVMEAWRLGDRPYMEQIELGALRKPGVATAALHDFDLRNLVAHGVSDMQNEVLSFFCFARMPGALLSRQRYFLELLVPHLHVALMRVLMRDAVVVEETVQLTAREKELMGWVREGKSNWEISIILDISEQTVKNHLNNVLRKLSAHNRGHAVAKAMRLRII